MLKDAVKASDAFDADKAVALEMLGGEDSKVTLKKAVLILSDFANGARSTSSSLAKDIGGVVKIINCSEHALDNIFQAAIIAEKAFLLDFLAKLKDGGTLSKEEKQYADINAFVYSCSKLLHVTNTDTYHLNLGSQFAHLYTKGQRHQHEHRPQLMRQRGSRFYAGMHNRAVVQRLLSNWTKFLNGIG